MKHLIFGLGNIGSEHEGTRHNIGFSILDAWAKAEGERFETERYAMVARLRHKGHTFVCLKPTTYMNLSGNAVRYWLQQEKASILDALVLVDDLALPFGTLRMKSKGSAGGHNGLTHIQQTLGHDNYPRLRFGIGDDYPKGRQSDYVLGPWKPDEAAALPLLIDQCVEAIKTFATAGISHAMTSLNKRKPEL